MQTIFINICRHFSKKNIIQIVPEMKYLNVAEKHDAAKNIAALLSNGSARRREGFSVYNKIFDFECMVRGQNCKMVMTSVSGHMLNYEFISSYKGWNTCDPHQLFDAPIRKSVTENGIKVKKTIEKEIKSCQGLIVWTDCDREGENIGFEVIEVCKAIRSNLTVYRAKFSEITSASIRRALNTLSQPDSRQNAAVDVRQEMDLRTGAAFTRYQTLRLQRLFPENVGDKTISYGSCQIPTLGFVAERYKEAEDFVSEPFWKIKVTHTIEELTVEFNWARNRLFDKEACEDYLMLCLADPKATVESVTVKPKNKWRPNPMDTVAMEKLGSKKLKINAKDTMAIAEKLYTQGLISYPRTETNSFSPDIDLKTLVELHTPHPEWGEFANRVLQWGPTPRNGNKSDQAHPPIHPTKFTTGLSGNEARIYELIVRHFLACVSKDATGSETIVNINIAGEKFHANGLVIYERNYLDVYPYEKWNGKQIHNYENGQVFDPTEISMQEGATTAPPLLTEADLITLMEKHGIGTDATHAEHIHKIKERGYIGEVDRGFLVPGAIGMGLYEGYGAMELTLAKPMLRAEFEADLKKVCNGEKDPKIVLREQIVKYKEAYKTVTDRIRAMDEKFGLRVNETPRENSSGDNEIVTQNQPHFKEIFKCPKCGICHMALKTRKDNAGYFIGCLNFPDCKNVVWLSNDIKEAVVSEETCSKCGRDVNKMNFKFKNTTYLGLLNATSTTYTTCLLCDLNFRNIFDINLSQIKNLGAIVGDAASTHSSSFNNRINSVNSETGWSGIQPTAGSSRGTTTGTSSNSFRNGNRNNRKDSNKESPKTKRVRKTIPKNSREITTQATTRITSFNSENYTGNIDFLDDEWETEFNPPTANVDTDLFNDDDSFDDILVNSEFALNEATENPQSTSNNFVGNNTADDLLSNWGTSNSRLSNNSPYQFVRTETISGTSNWGSSRNTSNRPSQNAVQSRTEITPNTSNWGSSGNISSRPSNNAIPSRTEITPSTSNWGSSGNTSSRPSNNAFASSSWIGSSASNPPPTKKPRGDTNTHTESFQSSNTSTFQRPKLQEKGSWGVTKRNEEQTNNNEVRCTVCKEVATLFTVKKDGPNKGREFFSCPKQCTFFQWADEPTRNTESTTSSSHQQNHLRPPNNNQISTAIRDAQIDDNDDSVKCNKCNAPAKSLTVLKEGPNKGRPFFVCPNKNGNCGFFKWGDENSGPSASTSWGTGAARGGVPQSKPAYRKEKKEPDTSTRQGQPKKRKCGLCRQEGHSKVTCPRKNEFDYN